MKKLVDQSQDMGVRKKIKSYRAKVNHKEHARPFTSKNLDTKITARTEGSIHILDKFYSKY